MIELTMLNSMVGTDFVQSLDIQQLMGIQVLDLKTGLNGKAIAEQTSEEAISAWQLIRERGMTVYCMSTDLFHGDIELGESEFRKSSTDQLERVIQTASVLRPTLIRLLAARSGRRRNFAHCADYLDEHHPWLIPLYQDAIDRIYAAGFQAAIENERCECILSHPDEIIAFFARLDREGKVMLTYDVQNLWEMGTYPSIEVYRTLAPIIGYLHLKGGQSDGTNLLLKWKSSLEEASWPIMELMREVIKDGVSPVICLNKSHGKNKENNNMADMARKDLAYLRSMIPEVR